MTTNASGKLNRGGVAAIKEITAIQFSERTSQQSHRLAACLTALAHQPTRWYSYQDWEPGGPAKFLADRGIEFKATPDAHPPAGDSNSYYDGCACPEQHFVYTSI